MGATSEGWGWWFREGQFSAAKTVFQRQTTGHTSMRQSLVGPSGLPATRVALKGAPPAAGAAQGESSRAVSPDGDLTGCAGEEGRRPGRRGHTHSFQKLLAPSVWPLSSRSPGSGAGREGRQGEDRPTGPSRACPQTGAWPLRSAALGDCRLEAGTWAQDDWSWAGRGASCTGPPRDLRASAKAGAVVGDTRVACQAESLRSTPAELDTAGVQSDSAAV